MLERDIKSMIMLAVSKIGTTIFNQPVGLFWTGDSFKRLPGGRLLITNPRPVHVGLHSGSSDLIGWSRVVITPDMVGHTVAVFTAVEVKTPSGRVSKDQENFLCQLREAGGIGVVARSVEDALRGISTWSVLGR